MATVLFKKSEQVQCNQRGKLTPYVVMKEKLHGEYERVYAECQNCGYQSTIYYTNKKLRSLLSRQEKETDVSKKKNLADKITNEMNVLLRLKFESNT